MEATKLHTDLEWEQNGMNGIHTKQGQCIATTFGENRKENALFICKAVNSHHKLVETLRLVLKEKYRQSEDIGMTDIEHKAEEILKSLK